MFVSRVAKLFRNAAWLVAGLAWTGFFSLGVQGNEETSATPSAVERNLAWERGLRSPLERTRQRTVKTLIDRGEEGAAFARKSLGHPDRRVRTGILAVLESLGEPHDLPALTSLGEDPDRGVRKAAAGAFITIVLRENEDPSSRLASSPFRKPDVDAWVLDQVKQTIDSFFRGRVPVRWHHDRPYTEVIRLGSLAVDPLEKLVRDPFRTSQYRAHALIALSRIGDPSTIPLFTEILSAEVPIELLEAEGGIESDFARPRILSSAVAGLANLGIFDEAGFQHSLEATNDFSEQVRSYGNWALTTWGQAKEEKVRRILTRSVIDQIIAERCDHVISMLAFVAQTHELEGTLNDLLDFLDLDPGYVRYDILETAQLLAPDHPGVIEASRKALELEDAPAMRVLAATHLGHEIDREELTEELLRQIDEGTIKGLTDQDQFGKKTGIKALALVGGERARTTLESFLDDGDDQIRSMAAAHLAVLEDSRSVVPLKKALDDRSEYVRLFAARTLLSLGERSGLPVLAELLDLGNRFCEEMALELLRSESGKNFGYDSTQGPTLRRDRARQWREWVEANGNP